MSSLVDWDLAVTTARRLVAPGPAIGLDEARAAVTELRQAAERAEGHVRELTRLGVEVGPIPAAVVVDRPGWVQANADGMAAMLTPLVARLQDKQGRPTGKIATAVGSRATGVQAGAVLAFVAARVLGQYEIFGPAGGRLLLVAPNIVDAERRLDVDPADFRLWVCLHEATHRLQFSAVPWLVEHLRGTIGEFVEATDVDADALRERLGSVLTGLAQAARGRGNDGGEGLLALIQNPEQRAILDRLTAVMSLLEGHAEYVMDEVGPSVVPSVATIRRRFGKRRQGTSPLDRVLRRLLGLDAKMKQYADGRRFVSGVIAEVGMDGFNAVWATAANLPRKDELDAPAAWVARVHGPRAVTA